MIYIPAWWHRPLSKLPEWSKALAWRSVAPVVTLYGHRARPASVRFHVCVEIHVCM